MPRRGRVKPAQGPRSKGWDRRHRAAAAWRGDEIYLLAIIVRALGRRGAGAPPLAVDLVLAQPADAQAEVDDQEREQDQEGEADVEQDARRTEQPRNRIV